MSKRNSIEIEQDLESEFQGDSVGENSVAANSMTAKSTSSKALVYWILLASLIAFGFYAQWLNSLLYLQDAPFYDSISYYESIFDVVSIREQKGLLPAIQNACFEQPSTICLPFLMAIPFSYFIEPCRAIGVWIEIIYLGIFLFSFAYFLDKFRGMSSKGILVSIVPLLLMNAIYRERAGISDLRIDLPMAFLYGSVGCWFLIACLRNRWFEFAIVGFLMGIACLSRGIAPVYLVAGFLPIVAIQFFRVSDKKKYVAQIGLALGITVLVAGWFYYYNFESLYFYYFVWNTDANAAVSLGRSLKHISVAAKSVGPFVAVFLLSLYVISRSIPSENQTNASKSQPLDSAISSGGKGASNRPAIPSAFYCFLWVGVAPLVVLIAKRADINPFVSLPATVGLMMFWMTFQHARIEQLVSMRLARVTYTCCICLILAMSYGYVKHRKGMTPGTAQAQNAILKVIQSDAKSNSVSNLSFSTAVMTHVCDASIRNSLQFDFGGKYVSHSVVASEDITYRSSDLFMLPAPANWDQIQGETIDEKIQYLVDIAEFEVDYLICPTADSVPNIEVAFPATLTSRYASKIAEAILSADFLTPISEPIDTIDGVKLVVLKNIGKQRLTERKANELLR